MMGTQRSISGETDLTATSTLEVPAITPDNQRASNKQLARNLLHDIECYRWWVQNQVQNEPTELFASLPHYNPNLHDHWNPPFLALWNAVSEALMSNSSIAIDEIIVCLVRDGFLLRTSNSQALISAKHLVFSVIGWQTMLYRPELRSCSPSELSIVDELNGHQGQAYMSLKQSHTACKKHMHEFLLGYGLLLPPRNFNAIDSPEEKTAFKEQRTATAASMNAYLLGTIAGVKIKWMDSLACHLDFDPYSNTLFLFRYPSFCVANLAPCGSVFHHKSVIHSCAAPDTGRGQWAAADDVTQLLNETIRSYRLLFGQKKRARHLFESLRPFDGIPEEGRDNFLTLLCAQKHCPDTVEFDDQEIYDLPRDFPILRSRLAILLRHLSNKEPRTWKGLWQDKRDSASWLTFWAVLIFGGMSIILALLQVILQIIQIVQQPSK